MEVIVIGIAARRASAGLTQKQLAEKIGVDQSAVAQWETGICGPRKDRMKLVADALGCSVSELLDDLLSNDEGKEEA